LPRPQKKGEGLKALYAALMEQRKGLMTWWDAMQQRSSVKKTQPNFG
jgi:hypothetical protein